MRKLTTVVSLALLGLLVSPPAEAGATPSDKNKVCIECW